MMYPENTDDTIYIRVGTDRINLGDLIARVEEKWGDYVDLDSIEIEVISFREHPGCSCCYDPSDYANYLEITKVK